MEKTKVLLLDDDADFLELMDMRLKSWGYDVILAKTGKEALDAVSKQRPDIAVLDYLLPDMDGVSVLRKIRKKDKAMSVIMFTAYPDSEAIKDADNLGITAFIPKLSIYNDTLAALKSALNISQNRLKKGA